MHFPTRLSGAVDSVMFSHSDLISRWAGIVFEPWYRFFSSYFFLVMSVVSEHFSHCTFFSGLLNGCLTGRLFDRKTNCCKCFKTMRRSDHEPMNRALFVPLSREREREVIPHQSVSGEATETASECAS